MQHLEEGTIHAWLDGELPAAERAAAEAHVAQCPECAAAVAEARGFIAASSRILTALDAVPGGVMPSAQAMAPVRRFMIPRAWMAVAAVLVLGIGTVIATRPRRDVAALRVAETRQEPKPTVMEPNVGPTAMDTLAIGAAMPAAPAQSATSGAANLPSSNAGGVAGGGAALRAGKMENRIERTRNYVGAVLNDSTPLMIADAVRAATTGTAADSKASAPSSAPATFADTARPRALALQEVVVTGAGVESSRETDDAEPRLVSRDSTTRGADTTVTTIYTVHGVRVALIERASRADLQRAETNFSGALMAKARVPAPAENSITWSDSTGRTRTLRGAISQAELERLKDRLFGATP
jgi:anti-sigma factor RsiW